MSRPPHGRPSPVEGEGGTRLVLRELEGPSGAPRLLLLHGFWRSGLSPRMRRLAAHFADRYRPFLLDMRGHGGSRGLFRFGAREVEDLALVLDHLLGAEDGPLGLLGFSMGGNFAVSAVGRWPERWPAIRSLATISAPVDPARLKLRWWDLSVCRGIRISEVWRVPRFLPPQLVSGRPDPLGVVARIAPVPLLTVHSRNDWLVPEDDARAYHERAREPKELRVVGNDRRCHADALLLYRWEETCGVLDDWFDRTLPSDAVEGACQEGRMSR